jgi:protein DGCR14
MASSPSTALAKRASDTALMPPPPKPKRQKRPPKVLDEDVYADAVSHIIARDFFPGLQETEAQQEYLAALDSNDNGWIREAGRKLTQIMTPGPEGRRRMGRGTSFAPRRNTITEETPRNYVGDTPARTPVTTVNDDFAPESAPEVDVNMSLGAFQAKYTSEDNESFNALLDKQNEKRTAKYAFFHNGNKILAPRQIAHRAREQKLLENGAGTSTALITSNSVGEERTAVASSGPSEDLDARLASVESFRNRQGPRNPFMFGPDIIEDTTTTIAQEAETKSNAPPRSVT